MITTNSKLIFAIILSIFMVSNSYAQDGETLFKQNCASCHKTNTKKLVGPGLQGVREEAGEDWVIKWTRSSKELIESGDARAIKVYADFNKTAMPPQNLKDEEIIAVFDYIDTKAVVIKAPTDNEEIILDSSLKGGSSDILSWSYGISAIIVFGLFGFIMKKA